MMMDREEGRPLRKKVSSSLIEPTLLGYQNAFTRNTTEEGWLDIISEGNTPKAGGDEQRWQRRWFEMREGVIRHAPSNTPADIEWSIFIPIENIVKLVTGNKSKRRRPSCTLTLPELTEEDEPKSQEYLITMTTPHERLVLRAQNTDDLNRWKFAFQRSVALAMTKIKTAQASSSLHHKLGRHDEEACKLEADEAFFLREVAANEDDGWESRGRNRATITSHVGHASSDSGVGFSGMGMGGINGVGTSSSTGKVLGRKASRSLSVDETFLPPPPPLVPQQRTPSASSMMRAAFKTNSFGDLVGVTGGGVAGGFAVPPELYSEGFCASSGLSPVGPFLSGQGVTPSDDIPRGVNGSSPSEQLSQSTESINSTWRSVGDMSACCPDLESVRGADVPGEVPLPPPDHRGKMSPSSYSVGRTRTASVGSGGLTCSSSHGSGGSGSLHGESIIGGSSVPPPPHHKHSPPSCPPRERTSSSISAVSGNGRSERISEDDLQMDDDDGMFMFDSLENSLEDFNELGHMLSSQNCGGQSPMSSYLSQASSLRVEFGACTRLGPKSKQEDRFVMIPSLDTPRGTGAEVEGYDDDSNTHRCEYSYAAVYDGHCGFEASEFVNETLHDMIYQHSFFKTDIELAIRESCASVDQTFLERARREDIYDGTTAIGAFFHPKNTQSGKTRSQAVTIPVYPGAVVRQSGSRMTVFNIGDSRAVLCRNGEAISMSDAHCPSRPDEQKRIEDAKGWITEEKELFVGRLHRMNLCDPDIAEQAAAGIKWTTIHRVLGEVAVSRSIGDYPYKGFVPGTVVKDSYLCWPDNHDQIFEADLVISDPESKHIDIDELCEFVILASDGLWDVVSNEKAVSRVKAAFERGESPKTASEDLCDLALKLGSGDNTTVIVVQLFHNMKGI